MKEEEQCRTKNAKVNEDDFLCAVRTNPVVRQFCNACRDNYIDARRRQVKPGSDIFQPPRPTVVEKAFTSKLTIKDPEYDLYQEVYYLNKYGKKPLELGLPVVTFDQGNGNSLRGVLVYAANWNAPIGCKRIVWSEEHSVSKRVELASSLHQICDDELATQMKSAQKKVSAGELEKSVERDEKKCGKKPFATAEFFMDESIKTGIFKSHVLLEQYIQAVKDSSAAADNEDKGPEDEAARDESAAVAVRGADKYHTILDGDESDGAGGLSGRKRKLPQSSGQPAQKRSNCGGSGATSRGSGTGVAKGGKATGGGVSAASGTGGGKANLTLTATLRSKADALEAAEKVVGEVTVVLTSCVVKAVSDISKLLMDTATLIMSDKCETAKSPKLDAACANMDKIQVKVKNEPKTLEALITADKLLDAMSMVIKAHNAYISRFTKRGKDLMAGKATAAKRCRVGPHTNKS